MRCTIFSDTTTKKKKKKSSTFYSVLHMLIKGQPQTDCKLCNLQKKKKKIKIK